MHRCKTPTHSPPSPHSQTQTDSVQCYKKFCDKTNNLIKHLMPPCSVEMTSCMRQHTYFRVIQNGLKVAIYSLNFMKEIAKTVVAQAKAEIDCSTWKWMKRIISSEKRNDDLVELLYVAVVAIELGALSDSVYFVYKNRNSNVVNPPPSPLQCMNTVWFFAFTVRMCAPLYYACARVYYVAFLISYFFFIFLTVNLRYVNKSTANNRSTKSTTMNWTRPHTHTKHIMQ